ncbi:hypothetical protein FisN_9Hh187 [Fistulifera solaris]|uniref:Uncharacterized protein n=1 Tax=Fistulifera solaris TaxID=1519565 RepID=A0A1Z5JAV9_FISSO|nr:hypothetical protein FisN_9Hh187 [Fistulifera solaris]|eukprot:GAX11096.1 hypothetical protein FisN_9Hh187 [Fistulifera solaris]
MRKTVLLLACIGTCSAFQPTTFIQNKGQPRPLFAVEKPKNEEPEEKKFRFPRFLKRWRNYAAITAFSLTSVVTPLAAQASAPVMAIPKAEQRDPITDALIERQRRQTVEAQQELQRMAKQAREIEATQGEAARLNFEKEYYRQKEEEAAAKKVGLRQLKLDLLEQGIDPFTDIEGQRQTILYEKGVDLAEVSGTPFNLEKELARRSPKKTVAFQKAPHRKIIACMVQELNNRGEDPIEYFQKHQDKTSKIMEMPYEKAALLAQQFSANLEQYGQVRKPAEGEKSVKEMMVKDPAQIKAEKEALAQAAKLKAKAEKEAAKAAAKGEKEAKKAQAELEKTASAAPAMETEALGSDLPADVVDDEQSYDDGAISSIPAPVPSKAATEQKISPIVPVSATIVTVAGGGYAINLIREKRAEAEAERQRQFKLLMGVDDDNDEDDSLDTDYSPQKTIQNNAPSGSSSATKKEVPTFEPQDAPAPKKRRLGIKGVFGKKGSGRATDLSTLVGPGGNYPQFAALLAKILTFGAPGRFPTVVKLPGGMPMDEFDLEKAKQLLTEARESSGLELADSAEIFANVVNCMLIDIVDLASTSLKEKGDVTVKSINIVVDFMNHAASLYESVAEGVVIKPVVYEGDLSKAKLEQLYSTYAVSGMMGMFGGDGGTAVSEDFDSRVALLQDVFQINEKKAEGLMMKAVQKNMLEMMKEGKNLEGMEEMLKGLGGMDGMNGLAGLMGEDGEGPSPEQLKEMLISLKQMKDSGSIPPNEFEEVKKQFKEAFGSSLDDVVKDASKDGELSSTEKELLELMKAIMDD